MNHTTTINYRQYLITVRNPIDRIISWYKYESYLQRTAVNGEIKSPVFRMLWSECYPTVEQLIVNGLLPYEEVASSLPRKTRTAGGTISRRESGLGKGSWFESTCRSVATQCLRGKQKCFAHNYYNYEIYLEDLILWKQVCSNKNYSVGQNDDDDKKADNTDIKDTSEDIHTTTTKIIPSIPAKEEEIASRTEELQKYGPPHERLDCAERQNIRIDVIRLEHTDKDFRRTMELWTDIPLLDLEDIGYKVYNAAGTSDSTGSSSTSTKQSNFGPNKNYNNNNENRNNNNIDKVQIQNGITNLCKHICTELII